MKRSLLVIVLLLSGPVIGQAGQLLMPPPGNGLYDYRTTLCQQDDFVSGTFGSGTTGQLSWFIAGGTTAGVNPATERPGQIQKSTTAVGSTPAYLLLSGIQSQVLPTLPYYIIWLSTLNQNDGDTIYRVGATSSGTTSPTGGSGVFFEKAAADTNWFLVTVVGGVAARTDSGVAVDTNWHAFKIVHNVSPSDSYEYWLDGVLVGTRTTNLPAIGIQPFTQIFNTTANAKTYNTDYFEWCVYGLNR